MAKSLSESFREVKAHGNRKLLLKGDGVGNLMGHVDVIPKVDISDMSQSGEEHHAYGTSRRKGKHGILHHVTRRLGAFNTHEEAVAAVKKFHKIEESTSAKGKLSEGDIINEALYQHVLESWYGNSSPLAHKSYTIGRGLAAGDDKSAMALRDKLYAVHQRHSEIADSLGREMDNLHGAKPGTPEAKRYNELGDKRDRHATLSNRAYAAAKGISSGQIAKK